jgi:hypothetical protein
MKKVRVILSAEAEEVYSHLNKEAPTSKTDRMILNAINKKVELIKANHHYGDPIAKQLIPKEYVTNYGITNLFRVELPNYWRMLYSLTNEDIEIIAFVLDIIDHTVYDKKFGYRKM